MLVNPRKRKAKRRVARKSISKRKPRVASSKTVTTRKYRRNPLPKMGGVMGTLKDGAVGAAGAVATEIILSKLPLPAQLASGNGRIAASALGSIGVGMLVAKFGKNKKLGQTMAQGGVTVALHSLMRGAMSNIPGVNLSGYDDGLLGYGDGLLAYSDYNDDLGWMSPAAVTGDEFSDYSVLDGYEDY